MFDDWRPFEVLIAKKYCKDDSIDSRLYYVVLRAPNFQTYEVFEGLENECEETCKNLNDRILASLSKHITTPRCVECGEDLGRLDNENSHSNPKECIKNLKAKLEKK